MSATHLVKALALKAGLTVNRHTPLSDGMEALVWHAQRHGAATLLDVGANTGQTGDKARKLGWGGPIVSFEPLPAARRALETAAANDSGWHVARACALGPAPGTARFNVSHNLASSSLLEVEARSTDAAPESGIAETIEVEIAPLDDVMEPDWRAPYAMKIDTQGFELEVLAGAADTLARTRIVLTEMSLSPLYRGGAGFIELYTVLEAQGLRCIGLFPGFADLAKAEMLQVDGLFLRDA